MKSAVKHVGIKCARIMGPCIPWAQARSCLRKRLIPALMDPQVLPRGFRPLHTRECKSKILADPYLYPHSSIFWFKRLYETHTARFLKATLRPGGTLVDIGMNLGHFTTLGAELVGDSGTVIAFEPNPNLCKLVGEHLATQGLGHVKIVNCALGSEEGSVTLAVPHGNTGHSFVAEITDRHAEEQHEQIEVPMRVGESELANVDTENLVVKLDVEGAELEVLEGMKQTLREKVHAMQIEIAPQWLGDSKLQRIQDLLGECGFATLSARKRGSPQPVNIGSIKEQQDVWCVRSECNPFRSSH